MKLEELLDHVEDEESFLDFAAALAQDKAAESAQEQTGPSGPYGPGARGWENGSIESFLEAAVAWARDSAFGRNQGLTNASPWKKFAVFLYCGKIYE